MSIIKLFYDYDFYISNQEAGITVNWNTEKSPHVLCVGATGSGKTIATKVSLYQFIKSLNSLEIILCDFKNDDYKFLEGCENYFSYLACVEGINKFYKLFQNRQSGAEESRTFKFLMIDEYASLLNTLEKKVAERVKNQLSTLLMLGRAYNCHIWITQQRPDSDYFAKARDNFSLIIAMGNLSKESIGMLGFDKEQMISCQRGQGHMLFNGCRQEKIIVPKISDIRKLDNIIKSNFH